MIEIAVRAQSIRNECRVLDHEPCERLSYAVDTRRAQVVCELSISLREDGTSNLGCREYAAAPGPLRQLWTCLDAISRRRLYRAKADGLFAAVAHHLPKECSRLAIR